MPSTPIRLAHRAVAALVHALSAAAQTPAKPAAAEHVVPSVLATRALFGDRPDNVFLVKATYWLGR